MRPRRFNPNCRTLTLSQMAEELGVSGHHIRNLDKRGELPVPVIELGNRRLVSREAVEELLGRRIELKDPAGAGIA